MILLHLGAGYHKTSNRCSHPAKGCLQLKENDEASHSCRALCRSSYCTVLSTSTANSSLGP
ncbi:UNVERIFIED_CONTAM: hypothetical protein FKN15_030832 [Acipenser sinensis]